ncbi:MAG: hypothetical protein OXU78_04490 [Deltaproteobacteria bacterium]|nr:hypothetical protein [Deltaproteobacteria bacterium]
MDTTMSGGFDTLSAANALQNVGFNREQAEVLSYTMARAHGDLATKADVDAVRREVSSLRSVVFGMVLPAVLANLGLMVAVLIHLLSA